MIRVAKGFESSIPCILRFPVCANAIPAAKLALFWLLLEKDAVES
jgi:hypothetical protein